MTSTDLQKRLIDFALNVLALVKTLPKTEENRIYGKQVIRSSSSVGANYSEAMYAHTTQDFLHGINISRKETNETNYWLTLILAANANFQSPIAPLLDEGSQLLKIFIQSIKTTKEHLKNGQ